MCVCVEGGDHNDDASNHSHHHTNQENKVMPQSKGRGVGNVIRDGEGKSFMK